MQHLLAACGRVMERDGRTLMVPPHAPPPSEGDCLRHCDYIFLFCNRPFYLIFYSSPTYKSISS